MHHDRITVLVVEDDPDEVLLIREAIYDAGATDITLVHAETLETGLSKLASNPFDAVLLDLSLPDCHGIEGVERVVQAAGEAPVIVCTGLNDQSIGREAIRSGAQDYLVKNPRLYGAIPRTLRYATERSRLIHSANKKVEKARKNTELLLTKVISIANSGLGIIDGAGNFVIANPALAKLVGRSVSEIIGEPWTNLLPKRDRATEQQAYIASFSHNDSYDREQLTIQHKDGGAIQVSVRSMLVDFNEDRRCRVLSFGSPSRSNSSEMSALISAQFADESKPHVNLSQEGVETIESDRPNDGLTRVANRKCFEDTLERAAAESEEMRWPLSLIRADLDDFKAFNDSHVYQVGNQVLKAVSDTLIAYFKGQHTAARYGGEGLAVILPNTTAGSAAAVAERIRKTVESKKLRNKSGEFGPIKLSMGVSSYLPGEAPKALIKRAERALHEAKKFGGNRVISVEGTAMQKIG